jgi:colanic acid/amylovoran biosynthesis glycosyltransferase
MSGSRTIGYLTSAYARASDSFIRSEVQELRSLGHIVHTFSIRRPPESEIVSEDIRRERARTAYVLVRENAAGMVLASARALLRSPRALAQAILLANRCSAPGIKGRIWSFAYVVEACFLTSLLRKHDIDHLHNHIGEGSATVAMLAAHLAGITFSLTIHGPGEFDHPRSLALDAKIRRATFTAAVSEYGRSQLLRWTSPEDSRKLVIVRCGVDGRFLARSHESIFASEPRLVFVGRLVVDKGILTLIEAVRALAETERFFEVVVIGDGPMRRHIEQAIEEHGIGDRVTLLGWAGGEAVRNEILRARALVLPSYAENLPVAIMEALALSRPVISTYIGGIPELVRDGECGWLVPAGSASALTTAMREALRASPDRLKRMGEAGAELVAEQHNGKTQAAKLARCMSGELEGAQREREGVFS